MNNAFLIILISLWRALVLLPRWLQLILSSFIGLLFYLIPIKRNKSTYDFSVTLGQRGTNSNNLLKENYIRFGLSMSFEGIWFVKQKYN